MSFLKKTIFFVAIFSLFAVPSAFAKRSLYYDPDTRSVYFGSKRTSRYNGYERKHGFYTPSYLSEKDKRSYRKHVRHSMERDKLSKKEQQKIKGLLKSKNEKTANIVKECESHTTTASTQNIVERKNQQDYAGLQSVREITGLVFNRHKKKQTH